jgi:3-oxoacyl-[acyl-carrier-protein] synthase II
MSQRRRVVITGLGVLTPIGNDVPSFWEAALKGSNGIRRVEHFDVSDMPVKIAGMIQGFDPSTVMDSKDARKTDPFVHFAIAAAVEAVRDSGMDFSKHDPYRVGVIMGTGIGGLQEIESGSHTLFGRGPGRVNPFFIPKLMPNAGAANVAIYFGIKGPNYTSTSACAASAHAVGVALRTIQYGDADIVLSGGSEAPVSRLGMAGFCAARAMAADRNDDPEHASRPFDANRSGFVMGEGAGVLVLEELEHAKKRGAKIYAEVVGFGATDDAFHITAPSEDGEGAIACMKIAMKDGGLNPEDVSYINAHGTSTLLNDKTESLAIRRVLGEQANKVLVSSTKSMVGHLLGGSGGVELVAAAMSLHQQKVHPTRNWENRDPSCDLDYIPGSGRDAKVTAVLKNSFGFGGHNATIALRAFEG